MMVKPKMFCIQKLWSKNMEINRLYAKLVEFLFKDGFGFFPSSEADEGSAIF